MGVEELLIFRSLMLGLLFYVGGSLSAIIRAHRTNLPSSSKQIFSHLSIALVPTFLACRQDSVELLRQVCVGRSRIFKDGQMQSKSNAKENVMPELQGATALLKRLAGKGELNLYPNKSISYANLL